jgi:hypothetical protein
VKGILCISLLLPVFFFASPEPGTKIPDDWKIFIAQVTRADPETLEVMPEKVFSFGLTLDGDHTGEFNNAVAIALLKAPFETLSALSVIDDYDVRENNRLMHRFDTYSIFGLPLVIDYDKESLNRYYQHAIQVLKKVLIKIADFACIQWRQPWTKSWPMRRAATVNGAPSPIQRSKKDAAS